MVTSTQIAQQIANLEKKEKELLQDTRIIPDQRRRALNAITKNLGTLRTRLSSVQKQERQTAINRKAIEAGRVTLPKNLRLGRSAAQALSNPNIPVSDGGVIAEKAFLKQQFLEGRIGVDQYLRKARSLGIKQQERERKAAAFRAARSSRRAQGIAAKAEEQRQLQLRELRKQNRTQQIIANQKQRDKVRADIEAEGFDPGKLQQANLTRLAEERLVGKNNTAEERAQSRFARQQALIPVASKGGRTTSKQVNAIDLQRQSLQRQQTVQKPQADPLTPSVVPTVPDAFAESIQTTVTKPDKTPVGLFQGPPDPRVIKGVPTKEFGLVNIETDFQPRKTVSQARLNLEQALGFSFPAPIKTATRKIDEAFELNAPVEQRSTKPRIPEPFSGLFGPIGSTFVGSNRELGEAAKPVQNFVSDFEDFGRAVASNNFISGEEARKAVPNNPLGLPIAPPSPKQETALSKLLSGNTNVKPSEVKASLAGESVVALPFLFAASGGQRLGTRIDDFLTSQSNKKAVATAIGKLQPPKTVASREFAPVESAVGKKSNLEIVKSQLKNLIPKSQLETSKIKVKKVTPNVFELESGNPNADKFIFAKVVQQGRKKAVDIFSVEKDNPFVKPENILVRGDVGKTEQLKFGLTQKGKQQFQTVKNPTDDLITATRKSDSLNPVGLVRRFSSKQINENPKEFGRFLFQESTSTGQTPAKPISETLIADTRSFATVGSKTLSQTPKGSLQAIPTKTSKITKRSESVFQPFKESEIKLRKLFGTEKFKSKRPTDTFVTDVQKTAKEIDPFADLAKFKSGKQPSVPFNDPKRSNILDELAGTKPSGKSGTVLKKDTAKDVLGTQTKTTTTKKPSSTIPAFANLQSVTTQTEVIAFPPRSSPPNQRTVSDELFGFQKNEKRIEKLLDEVIPEQKKTKGKSVIVQDRIQTFTPKVQQPSFDFAVGVSLGSKTKQSQDLVPVQRQPQRTDTPQRQRNPQRTVTTDALVPIFRTPPGQPAVPFNPGTFFFRLPFFGGGSGGGIGAPSKRTRKGFAFDPLDPLVGGVISRARVKRRFGLSSRIFGQGERELARARKNAPSFDIFGEPSVSLDFGVTKKTKQNGSKKRKKDDLFGSTAIKLNI